MIVKLKYSPGDSVEIGGEEKVPAVINHVRIERGAVMYECEWWTNRIRNTADFYENELVPVSTPNPLLVVKNQQGDACGNES